MSGSNPLVRFVATFLALAIGLRVGWELLRPVLVPVVLVGLVGLFVAALVRRP